MIQVENYLMLSEYEQNLIKEIEGPEGVRTEPRAVRIVFFLFLTSGPGKASKKVEPGETGEQHAG